MKSRRLIGIFALTLAGALSPAVAPAQEAPTYIVSSEMMDTLEEWTSPAASAETLALGSRPELIEEYAALTAEHYGGRALAEVFAENLPQTWAQIVAALGGSGEDGGETPAPAEILAYAMAGGGEEFHSWQGSLADGGADFPSFIAERHAEVADELADLAPSPASRGIGLRDFAEAKGTAGALDLMDLEQNDFEPLKQCYCWTAVSFDDRPGPGWFPQAVKHEDKFDYTVKGRGAARDLDFNRRSEHSLTEKLETLSGSFNSMRVHFNCIRAFAPSLTACPVANPCTGKLYAGAGYASKVYENHSVGGIWTRDAKTLAADFARLTYDAPGGPFGTVLFSKGVAVAGSYQSDWSYSYALASQFYAAAGLPLFAAPVGTASLSTLGTNLNNPATSGFAGLAFMKGVSGSYALTMKAGWRNSIQPIHMLPFRTHTITLAAGSRAYGRGLGGQSDTRNHLDSAIYLVAMTRSFSCAPSVIPPVDRAFWTYDRAPDAPYDSTTLQGLVRDDARNFGSTVSNVSAATGQFP